MPETTDPLAASIADASLLRGEFTLRSGRTSKYYLDKYLFTSRPEILKPLAERFAKRLGAMEQDLSLRVDRLAGAELGGIPLVTAAGLETGLPCIFVRNAKKDYGTSKQIEGTVNKGDHVVLLEDVATSGGQAIEAVNVLREAGADVLGVIVTIDREEGAREAIMNAGVRFDAIFTKSDLRRRRRAELATTPTTP
jgi:orotate phosphoribosyltransferase